MLGEELVDAESSGGSVELIERRVAFTQRDGIAEAVENGEQLAKAPHTGLVERFAGASPLTPKPFERAGIGPVGSLALVPTCVLYFKKIAALGATKVGSSLRAGDANAASETAQLM